MKVKFIECLSDLRQVYVGGKEYELSDTEAMKLIFAGICTKVDPVQEPEAKTELKVSEPKKQRVNL